ncbi:MAG: hypothetical protein GY841_09150 [FCB group bacterium]|nr:hypothetical protein [FCB group bacterium]
MLKKTIFIFAVSLLIVSNALAGSFDKTPYKFLLGGNSYTTDGEDVTNHWLAERYDAGLAGLTDWPGMMEYIDSTRRAEGEWFLFGPYASSQEINLYERFDKDKPYNQRLQDTEKHWQYIYAKHYLDSIGVSPESLVVHLDDNAINLTQFDGSRSYDLSGLPHHKKRFTYQYWNNTSSDTMFYPAGYVWLANGNNEDARNALAYAFRRHFIEDSALYGNGKAHWTAYFMDNQYRNHQMPRMNSYYTINSSSGGPTSVMDWAEKPGIESTDACTEYFDESTRRIDSTIMGMLDSTCAANGLDRVYGFANINKESPIHLSHILSYVNAVSLEHPIDYNSRPGNWRNWYDLADTMAAHPEVYINWSLFADYICSSDPGSWRFDSNRVYLMHYSFFLTVQDTNAFLAPGRFNKMDRWRKIYEIDFGKPDGLAYEVSQTGTSDYGDNPYIYVMRRDYDGGNTAVILRTADSQADHVGDSVEVNVHGLFYEVSADGDTSAVADSIYYLKPYMGKILVAESGSYSEVTVLEPAQSARFVGSNDALIFRVTDSEGIDSLRVWLERSMGDTILLDVSFPDGVTSYTASKQHTWSWDDCGFNYLGFYIRDKEGNVTYLPEAKILSVASEEVNVGDAVFIINFLFKNGPAPYPYSSGDSDCDGIVNVGDAVYLINHVFKGGPPVCCPREGY